MGELYVVHRNRLFFFVSLHFLVLPGNVSELPSMELTLHIAIVVNLIVINLLYTKNRNNYKSATPIVARNYSTVQYSTLSPHRMVYRCSSHTLPQTPHLPHLPQQVFVACGVSVLLFEIAAVPYLTPWLGVKLSQRLGSLFEVPIYFLLPLVSRMGGDGLPVTLVMVVLLFTCYVCTNSVSACGCWVCSRGRTHLFLCGCLVMLRLLLLNSAIDAPWMLDVGVVAAEMVEWLPMLVFVSALVLVFACYISASSIVAWLTLLSLSRQGCKDV